MKKIFLILLGVVFVLPAVEWDVEQVTNDIDYDNYYPVLTLDEDDTPWVLYYQHIYNLVEGHLKIARKSESSWEIREVVRADEAYEGYYSFDVNSQRDVFVAYFDWIDSEEQLDIFLAVDTSGDFETTNLTQDELDQFSPVVRIDNGGNIHLAYVEFTDQSDVAEVYYGTVEEGTITPSRAAMSCEGWAGIDLVLDGQAEPHIFYVEYDELKIWHSWRSTQGQGWESSKINNESGWSACPAAAVDGSGKLHVVYVLYDQGINYVKYTNNRNVAWQKEAITSTNVDVYYSQTGIALDPEGNPHAVWLLEDAEARYDVYYAGKQPTGWNSESVTDTPEEDEEPGRSHYFAIDSKGYGHLVYDALDAEGMVQIYYAKTKDPLVDVGVEEISRSGPLSLEIRSGAVVFILSQSSDTDITLYDAAGRRVEEIVSGVYESGEHSVPINTTELATGIYFVRAEIAGQQESAKFILMQ